MREGAWFCAARSVLKWGGFDGLKAENTCVDAKYISFAF